MQQQPTAVFKDYDAKLSKKFEKVFKKLKLHEKEVEEVIKSQQHTSTEYEEIKKQLQKKRKKTLLSFKKTKIYYEQFRMLLSN